MHDSVAHSQMKGSFSTSSYLPAAVAIFSFASLNVESLRAIRSSLDCMPQLIHSDARKKPSCRKARPGLAHLMRHPQQFGCALLSATLHGNAARRIAAAEGDGERRRITNELRE